MRPDDPDRQSSAPEADVAMARYADGDRAAFVVVYQALAPRLRPIVARAGAESVDDVLQHTFLRMHEHRGCFIRGARVLPWAISIALRLVVDTKRRGVRRDRIFDRGEAPEKADPNGFSPCDILDGKVTWDQMERCLSRLPDNDRRAFELVALHGLTLQETAELEGSTIPAIKSRVHRAREALRDCLRREA